MRREIRESEKYLSLLVNYIDQYSSKRREILFSELEMIVYIF